jgi:hypothetical protein
MTTTSGSFSVSDKASIEALHQTIKEAIAATDRSATSMHRLTRVGVVIAITGAVLASLQVYVALYPPSGPCGASNSPPPTTPKSFP